MAPPDRIPRADAAVTELVHLPELGFGVVVGADEELGPVDVLVVDHVEAAVREGRPAPVVDARVVHARPVGLGEVCELVVVHDHVVEGERRPVPEVRVGSAVPGPHARAVERDAIEGGRAEVGAVRGGPAEVDGVGGGDGVGDEVEGVAARGGGRVPPGHRERAVDARVGGARPLGVVAVGPPRARAAGRRRARVGPASVYGRGVRAGGVHAGGVQVCSVQVCSVQGASVTGCTGVVAASGNQESGEETRAEAGAGAREGEGKERCVHGPPGYPNCAWETTASRGGRRVATDVSQETLLQRRSGTSAGVRWPSR